MSEPRRKENETMSHLEFLYTEFCARADEYRVALAALKAIQMEIEFRAKILNAQQEFLVTHGFTIEPIPKLPTQAEQRRQKRAEGSV
jgi:hypothetical protein